MRLSPIRRRSFEQSSIRTAFSILKAIEEWAVLIVVVDVIHDRVVSPILSGSSVPRCLISSFSPSGPLLE